MGSWLLGTHVPLAERIYWLSDNGFDAVSFATEQFIESAKCGFDKSAEAALVKTGLVVMIHPSPGAVHSEKTAISFARNIEMASELQKNTGQVRSVGIDPAWRSKDGIVVYDSEGTERALSAIIELFKDEPTTIAVENWKINPEYQEFLRLKNMFGAEVELHLLLDLGHLHVMHEDAAAIAGVLPLKVSEVHVSDNSGDNDDHLPLGKGTLPLKDIIKQLAGNGFDGVYTFEIRARYNFSKCSIRHLGACKTIKQSRDLLREALAEANA